ncbi:hypothetical protein KSF78_0004108 [Schistosoma japonicum]|nr:hypothetical protein KSF78_0004108 [Schistosoma japonicum]
MMPIILV